MQLKRILMTGLGFIFLSFGAIGAFLPVWPTTPFVLLAVACLYSQPRIRASIMKVPFFREHIENYSQRTGLSKKSFLISLLWLWGMLILSMFLTGDLRIALLLFLVGSAVTLHICIIAKGRRESDTE